MEQSAFGDAEHPDKKEPLLATLLGTQAGDWITITPAGYYVAFGENAYKLLRVVRGLETYSLRNSFSGSCSAPTGLRRISLEMLAARIAMPPPP